MMFIMAIEKGIAVRKRERIKSLKKIVERVAFISLIADIAIATVTLVSLNTGRSGITLETIFLLNYILTAIVIIAVILFVSIFLLSYYDKMYDTLMLRWLRKGIGKSRSKRSNR
jgi:uncharacterized membrane protein